MRGNKLNYIFIAASIVMVFLYVFVFGDIEDIGSVIGQMAPIWFIAAILLMVVYWLGETLMLHAFSKKIQPKTKFKDSLSVTMLGQFFNAITPFSSGGQPMQAYYMVKLGTPVHAASAALIARSTMFQVVLVLYCIVVLVFRLNYFVTNVSGFAFLAVVGFVLNTIVVLFFFAVTYFQKATTKGLSLIIKIAGKLRFIKKEKVDALQERIGTEVKSFSASFATVRREKMLLVKTFFLGVLQLTAYFLIPYTIYMGFGLSGADIFTMISAQALITMISAFIPLPGASGAAEGSFVIFFGLFFPKGVVAIAMLIWRFITFYMSIIVGMGFTIKTGMSKDLKKKPAKKAPGSTEKTES